MRVTRDKIGRLFEWGEQVFDEQQQLHLVGPNQDGLAIPKWVNYHGALPAAELLTTWYPSSCGFITLSEHSEGKPQVLLETLAAGMPVIASRIPAHEETITAGEEGFLVESAEQLKAAISRLSDAQVHQRLSHNCRAASASAYGTWDDCLARYKTLYGELL